MADPKGITHFQWAKDDIDPVRVAQDGLHGLVMLYAFGMRWLWKLRVGL